MVKRGDIYWIKPGNYVSTGYEIYSDRPAVIVSNNIVNSRMATFNIVYLTTADKKESPARVKVMGSGRESTALCEQIQTVSHERIGEYIGECTAEELAQIDEALAIELGLTVVPDQKTERERDTYKILYEALLEARLNG